MAIWAHWAGIKMMDATLASFLNRSETLVTISLGIGILGERFTRSEALGGFLVLGGIVLMKFTLRAEYSTGFWVVLFGAVCFGTAEFFAKIAVRYVDPLTISFLRTVTTAVFFWIMVAVVGTSFEGTGSVWWALIILVKRDFSVSSPKDFFSCLIVSPTIFPSSLVSILERRSTVDSFILVIASSVMAEGT